MLVNSHAFIGSVALWLLIFFLLCFEGQADDEEPTSNIRKLRNDLLNKYDRFAGPVKNASKIIPVMVQLMKVVLLELNEIEATITLDSFAAMLWKDEQLQWDSNKYDGLRIMRFGDSETWRPDLVIFNSVPITENMPWNKSIVVVLNTGHVIWFVPVSLKTRCSVPFSESNENVFCNVTIGSHSHYKHELDLKLAWTEVNLGHLYYNKNPVWEIKNITASTDTTEFESLKYSFATFTIHLKREYDFVGDVVRGPRTITNLLTLLMFWLPSTCDKKLNLGCLVLLVLSGIIVYLSSTVVSPSLLAATVASLRITLFTATSALLVEVAILNLSRLSEIVRPTPTLIRILNGKVGKVVGVCSRLEYKEETEMVTLPEIEDEETYQPTITIEEEWSLFAMALDRLFFFIYSFIFVIIS